MTSTYNRRIVEMPSPRVRLLRAAALLNLALLLLALALCVQWSCAAPLRVNAGAQVHSTPDPMQMRRDILADPEIQQRMVAPDLPALPNLPDADLSFLRWIVIGIGAVLIVALIVLLGPLLFRYFVAARRRQHKAIAGPGAAEAATSAEAVQRAQVASAVQDYRLALRMLYLASLLKLAEIGALRYDRALTNREYVCQTALQPALADALRPVVETFDDVWYGYRPVTPAGYRAFESSVSVLMQAAEAHGRD